jgi:uncharacterized protein (TIGR02147 family)
MKALLSITSYLDYREFLRDAFETLKKGNAEFSYRAFAKLCGSNSPNYLQLILANKLNMQIPAISLLAPALKLSRSDISYFTELLLFNHAKTFKDRDNHYQNILRIKALNTHAKIDKSQYSYYSKWYHSAVRALLGYYQFNPQTDNYNDLGRQLRPGISGQQAKSSIALLEKLSLIRLNNKGCFEQSSPVVTSGSNIHSLAVTKYQTEMMRHAITALQECPLKQRDISTLTMNISGRNFDIMRNKIIQLRKELIELAREDNDDDRVYQLNIQFFPLTKFEN